MICNSSSTFFKYIFFCDQFETSIWRYITSFSTFDLRTLHDFSTKWKSFYHFESFSSRLFSHHSHAKIADFRNLNAVFFLQFIYQVKIIKLLIEQSRKSAFTALTKTIRISFSSFASCLNESKKHVTIVRFDIMHICAILIKRYS